MKHLSWLLLLVGIAAGWYFWPTTKALQQPGRIDTVYVDRLMPILRIDTIEVSKPYQVTVYLPDTSARKQAERQDIITSIELTNGLLSLSKLTPRGIGIKQEYKILEIGRIRIDGTGNVEITEDKKLKRKLFWRKVKRTAIVVGVGIAGFFAGSI